LGNSEGEPAEVHINYQFLQNAMTQHAHSLGALHPAGSFRITSLEHFEGYKILKVTIDVDYETMH